MNKGVQREGEKRAQASLCCVRIIFPAVAMCKFKFHNITQQICTCKTHCKSLCTRKV